MGINVGSRCREDSRGTGKPAGGQDHLQAQRILENIWLVVSLCNQNAQHLLNGKRWHGVDVQTPRTSQLPEG